MNLTMKKAVIEDAEKIADLIQDVYEDMEQKAWYVPDNAEYTKKMMESGKGVVYEAVDEDTGIMAGIVMATYPGICEENLGNEIGLSANQMLDVVHMESAAVRPEYRGNGIQGKLMDVAEKEAVERGKHYLMCTIHPDNRFSRANAMSRGYNVMKTKEKYGGLIRDIMLKIV